MNKRDSNHQIEWELYFSAGYSFYSKYIQAISNDGCIITFSALKIGESEPFAGYLKVSSDGEIEQNYFGETIGLDETQLENHLFIVTYPNPGQMSVLIEGDYDVEIYSFSGKFIKKHTTNELIELPSGKHYVFLVKKADNMLHSGKSFIR